MNDPILTLFTTALPVLMLLALAGFAFRMAMLVLAFAAIVRNYRNALDALARAAPPQDVAPAPAWIAQAAQLPAMWEQMNTLQKARFETRKAEMMGIAARAGISWHP